MDFMKGPKQTILFSATMPASIHLFGMASLVDPIEINVGRAGAGTPPRLFLFSRALSLNFFPLYIVNGYLSF